MPTRSARTRLQAGFTLTEAITATATVLIVVALLIPMFGNGLSRSGVYISANNLRRISMGCAAYEASWGGILTIELRSQKKEREGFEPSV